MLRLVYFVLMLLLEVLLLLVAPPFLVEVPCHEFVTGVWGGRAAGGRGSSRLYRVSQGDDVDRSLHSVFCSILLFLLFYSFVGVLSQLLDVLKGIQGVKGLLNLGGTLYLMSIGVLFVAMVLVVPFLLFIPGKIGFLLICMVFIGGCLILLRF